MWHCTTIEYWERNCSMWHCTTREYWERNCSMWHCTTREYWERNCSMWHCTTREYWERNCSMWHCTSTFNLKTTEGKVELCLPRFNRTTGQNVTKSYTILPTPVTANGIFVGENFRHQSNISSLPRRIFPRRKFFATRYIYLYLYLYLYLYVYLSFSFPRCWYFSCSFVFI